MKYSKKKLTNGLAKIKKQARGAWKRGVAEYALELVENADAAAIREAVSTKELEKVLLNGAEDWKQYSEGGCTLIYSGDIAERVCSPSELRRVDGGKKEPNARETWLEVQERALIQAWWLIESVC